MDRKKPQFSTGSSLLSHLANKKQEVQEDEKPIAPKAAEEEKEAPLKEAFAKPLPKEDKATREQPTAAPSTGLQETKKESKRGRKAIEGTDKKEPYASIIPGSLQRELNATLHEYRKNVNYEYNKAQFTEDAVRAQIKALKRELKSMGKGEA